MQKTGTHQTQLVFLLCPPLRCCFYPIDVGLFIPLPNPLWLSPCSSGRASAAPSPLTRATFLIKRHRASINTFQGCHLGRLPSNWTTMITNNAQTGSHSQSHMWSATPFWKRAGDGGAVGQTLKDWEMEELLRCITGQLQLKVDPHIAQRLEESLHERLAAVVRNYLWKLWVQEANKKHPFSKSQCGGCNRECLKSESVAGQCEKMLFFF